MDESVVYPVIIVLSKVYESYTSSLLLPFQPRPPVDGLNFIYSAFIIHNGQMLHAYNNAKLKWSMYYTMINVSYKLVSVTDYSNTSYCHQCSWTLTTLITGNFCSGVLSPWTALFNLYIYCNNMHLHNVCVTYS